VKIGEIKIVAFVDKSAEAVGNSIRKKYEENSSVMEL
jgi:hypothetical protein